MLWLGHVTLKRDPSEALLLRRVHLLALSRQPRRLGLRYFLDTEFNGFGGSLISLALVRQDGQSLYLLYEAPQPLDPWVERHVLPRLKSVPAHVLIREVSQAEGARAIGDFLEGDPNPDVVADWPDDIRLFCGALMLRPGSTVLVERLTFEIVRVEPYPTDMEDAVEHNAWWDAMALRRRLTRHSLPDH